MVSQASLKTPLTSDQSKIDQRPARKPLARKMIGVFRLSLFSILCLFAFLSQPIILLLSRNQRIICFIPSIWHRAVCKIMRISVICEGRPSKSSPTFFTSNHISYLDIPVLGQLKPAYFIAKTDVAQWPFFGWLTKLQKTVFIKREKTGLQDAGEKIMAHLNQRRSLVVFPEGTSGNGECVLPFKSSLFNYLLHPDLKLNVTIQPVTIKIVEINGVTAPAQSDRDLYAWYGEMELPPHLWNFACAKGAVLKVIYHDPFHIGQSDNRKTLCQRAHDAVAGSF